ncbi:MAG: hypothetical protein A2754_01545 [Candidatus Magasanikbacteria bacterium RIFCSPHIGHO2_01_FULL_47_8]|uniref:Uncharacterized protein n=1 Tax=Candidatus Magasanikbacteria bacterium RIFCSPHIGHO2_01_FULL_47_8 TaxID=1798673 RepID=A0A1F6MCA6_9BACT|nr:MAG: hypothetical protein A2754_01545 [Candidatus Magasanikbacteria bacterium RIFCSPHIGHO2_01_FULL_47_8]
MNIRVEKFIGDLQKAGQETGLTHEEKTSIKNNLTSLILGGEIQAVPLQPIIISTEPLEQKPAESTPKSTV